MASANTTHHRFAYLDGIRNREGVDSMKRRFHDIAGNDREHAAGLLNEPNVWYPSLFALQPEIVKNDLTERMCGRNLFALNLTNGVLAGNLTTAYRPTPDEYPHLRWMLETGHASDGMNEQYDEVVDKVSLLLSRVYGDRACLRTIEDLMFRRHRKGTYIYDLVWAYFESSKPDDLLRLAHRLRSPNPKDVELARKLLNFVPCIENNEERSPERQYRCVTEWLRRNRRRLMYTGQSMQMTNNPHRYALSDPESDAEGEGGDD